MDLQGIALGLDIGTVSVKLAALIPNHLAELILSRKLDGADFAVLRAPTSSAGDGFKVLILPPRRTRALPVEVAHAMLRDAAAVFDRIPIVGLAVTGAANQRVADAFGGRRINGFQALARAAQVLCPDVRTVLEIGGESSKFLRLGPAAADGEPSILDYGSNGDCAAGTGSFLDQQAGRLQYRVEVLGDVVATARRSAQIAGRCSVFAKSDMIHAQQKGFTPPEVLSGLCAAVASNYRSAVVKGRRIDPPVALVGGVAANSAVVRAIEQTLELPEGELLIPEAADSFGAIGAAAFAAAHGNRDSTRWCPSGLVNGNGRNGSGKQHPPATKPGAIQCPSSCESASCIDAGFATSPPLCLDRVRILRDQAATRHDLDPDAVVDAYLGLDIGSVGTKLVVIDDDGAVIHDIFTRTEGRPIEVVTRCLREIAEAVGARIRIRGVGTTGSGRELIGELIGADSINDEITAHKTGAAFIGDALLGRRPDTIFEIGGQDSKYISLEPAGDGSGETIVVDFTMNEACAAGTGSFLEERAEELGVSIKGEFARLALSATTPVKLGERCTVFMERDVNACMQRGAGRENIIAGLAYSVAHNYINRVVRGRHIGDCVFFQGGTAYNDAVAAAFSMITGKEIIVPPHNAVLGAIGAALLAREKVRQTRTATRFRGYRLDQVEYRMREINCHGCGNQCSVQEFTVDGEKTYWGDKCSDRFRKRAKSPIKPVIADLVALRKELLYADDTTADLEAPRGAVGLPLAMYTLDLLPLWRRFFRECGFRVVVSSETNRRLVDRALDCVVAEPCFPIIVAHGHVAELFDRGVDWVWLPNILSPETPVRDRQTHACPWGQTLPFVARQSPALKAWQQRILCPTLEMHEGPGRLREVLAQAMRPLGVPVSQARQAFDRAYAAQQRFRETYVRAGTEALDTLQRTGESGVVIVGRPYNIHDAGISLSTARKLRDLYGVNVIPVDALPVAGVDVSDVNDNMYWEYGRRILAAAKLVGRHPNLHILYITNFKCGPDSFIKAYVRAASGKPFLTLQFDGHANDAGMMTRCEAYLDSKGILRWWRKSHHEAPVSRSTEEPCISRKCPTPVLD